MADVVATPGGDGKMSLTVKVLIGMVAGLTDWHIRTEVD